MGKYWQRHNIRNFWYRQIWPISLGKGCRSDESAELAWLQEEEGHDDAAWEHDARGDDEKTDDYGEYANAAGLGAKGHGDVR